MTARLSFPKSQLRNRRKKNVQRLLRHNDDTFDTNEERQPFERKPTAKVFLAQIIGETMKTKNIILLLAVLLVTSCIQQSNFSPKHLHSNGASAIPFVPSPNGLPLPCTNASVNGKEGLFMIDTGANVTIIDPRFAKELDLKMFSIRGWRISSNVNKEMRYARVETLTLGNHAFDKFTVVILDLTHLCQPLSQRIDGIIGLNIMSKTAMCQIDSRRGQLSFEHASPDGDSVPFVLEDGGMFMDAEICGQKRRMRVDTGSTCTTLNSAEWPRLPISVGSSTNSSSVQTNITNINGVKTTNEAPLFRAECNLGNGIRKNLTLLKSAENLLGMDFFRHYTVTFDFENGNAYFKDYATNQVPKNTEH